MGLVGDALSELGAQRRELESWRELGGQILDELESGTVSEATTARIRAMLEGEEDQAKVD